MLASSTGKAIWTTTSVWSYTSTSVLALLPTLCCEKDNEIVSLDKRKNILRLNIILWLFKIISSISICWIADKMNNWKIGQLLIFLVFYWAFALMGFFRIRSKCSFLFLIHIVKMPNIYWISLCWNIKLWLISTRIDLRLNRALSTLST